MRITLPSGTPAEIARPDGAADRGLVVIPDIGSLRPLFDDHVARLAAENGWVVCAFELWGGRDDLPTLEDRLAAGGSLDDERVLGDAVAAADATGVEPVGVMGFCMGGMYALKAAGTGRFARAVSFYGMGRVPEMWQSPTQGEPLDCARRARRVPGARDRRHRRPVAAGRRPRRPRGRGRGGRAVRGRRPRLRPRPVAAGPPRGRRRRRLAPRHRPPQRRLTAAAGQPGGEAMGSDLARMRHGFRMWNPLPRAPADGTHCLASSPAAGRGRPARRRQRARRSSCSRSVMR